MMDLPLCILPVIARFAINAQDLFFFFIFTAILRVGSVIEIKELITWLLIQKFIFKVMGYSLGVALLTNSSTSNLKNRNTAHLELNSSCCFASKSVIFQGTRQGHTKSFEQEINNA